MAVGPDTGEAGLPGRTPKLAEPGEIGVQGWRPGDAGDMGLWRVSGEPARF